MQTRAAYVLPCANLDAAIDHFTQRLGFRLDMVMPADAPRVAEISGYGVTIRLEHSMSTSEQDPQDVRLRLPGHFTPQALAALQGIARVYVPAREQAAAPPEPLREPLVVRAHTAGCWHTGRAGMQYRDLVPGRLGGRVIASQIRIPDGGDVADYVHYHQVDFQMIHCRRGWVRVVYEDQGPAFVMHAGDCVLQPPRIRHRVLEASPGLEVIEVGCPAEHETRRDHGLELPTGNLCPDRDFGGQRFVRHVAASATWRATGSGGFDCRDTGIAAATAGYAAAEVMRAKDGGEVLVDGRAGPGLLVFLEGTCRIDCMSLNNIVFDVDDVCVIPARERFNIAATGHCEVLHVRLPADEARQHSKS